MNAGQWANIAGMVGGAITFLGTVALIFKRKADTEALRIENEAKHSQATLDRLQRMEAAEMFTDKKIDDLRERATTAEVARERLEWQLTMSNTRIQQLEGEVSGLSSEREMEKRRAQALATELANLKKEVASGSARVTPLRPPTK